MRTASGVDAALARAAEAHARLARRVVTAPSEPAAVLALGSAVVFHGAIERLWLLPEHPLLDPAVVAQLEEEHARLAADLELMETLWMSDARSGDLTALAGALLERLRAHVARDQRLLYRSGDTSPEERQPAGS